MSSTDYFSAILRTESSGLEGLVALLEKRTGKRGVLDNLKSVNELKTVNTLIRLGLSREARVPQILEALTRWVTESEESLLATVGPQNPQEQYSALCRAADALSGNQRGFFLKIDKAKEILEHYPPPNVLRLLGYADTKELLFKENILEVWAALRFVETREWMNETFLAAYRELQPSDFEERTIQLFVLPKRWLDTSQQDEAFVKKKYHNVSHLKEMGVIFVLPIAVNLPGAMLRIFMLLLHYLHEVPFYSRLFRKAQGADRFAEKLISYLRGDVTELSQVMEKNQILVIQRYLAKDDPRDKRLFFPHINPEAMHWRKAENDLGRFAATLANPILDGWQDLDWVGGFFDDVLVSFNLVDALMSVISRENGNAVGNIEVKYRYHHQEALWNKIFAEYLGETVVEQLATDNLEKGYFVL